MVELESFLSRSVVVPLVSLGCCCAGFALRTRLVALPMPEKTGLGLHVL